METNKAIKAFCEKKANAETMRIIFGITAILYIGFIIWTICIKNWSSLWWEFNVWLLLVALAFNKNSEIIDAELAISAIELEETKAEFELIANSGKWVYVSEMMPDDNETVIIAFRGLNSEVRYAHDVYHDDFGWEGYDADAVIAWMPIKKLPN